MAGPTYATDLLTVNDGSSGSWLEFTGNAQGSAPTETDTDNFIQGTYSTTEAVRNSGGSSISSPSSTTTVTSGDAVFFWFFFAAMPNMDLFADDGFAAAIGNALTTYDMWTVHGRDTLPYGGWFSVAIDPTATPTNTYGGGGSGTLTYFGSVIQLGTGIAKGNAFAVDHIRKGRSLICTVGDSGTPATFVGAAQYNDYNDVTNGYNRFGLFAAVKGGYSQKGLFQMGSSGTAVYFADTNRNIVIEDTLHVATGFNEFEVLNAGSTVLWTGIQISALGTQSPGLFTVTDNATVTLTGCTFNDMGAFALLSNTSALKTTFRRCGQITAPGSDMQGSIVTGFEGTANTSSLVWNVATNPVGLLDGMTFEMGTALTHAIEFGTTAPEAITLNNITFTGYDEVDNNQNDSTLHVKRTSGTTTISITGTGTAKADITYRTEGATVVLAQNVVVTFDQMKDNSEVRVYDHTTGVELDGIETATAGTTDDRNFPATVGAGTVVDYVVHNVAYETIRVENYTWPSVAQDLIIQQRIDRNYENPA